MYLANKALLYYNNSVLFSHFAHVRLSLTCRQRRSFLRDSFSYY